MNEFGDRAVETCRLKKEKEKKNLFSSITKLRRSQPN